MARQVIWSFRAQEEKREILKYWSQRNKSTRYSKNLNQLFKDSVELIREHPHIGKLTDTPYIRIKIVKDYLLIYEVSENAISILSIWDSRQDPDKLSDILT